MLNRLFIHLCLIVSAPALAQSQTFGDAGDNRLAGTASYDIFYGGDGADVFVVSALSEQSARTDWVLDFDPEEGDRVELMLDELGLSGIKTSQISLSTKGVVSLNLDTSQVPLIDIGRGDLTFELDSRKGRYFLKFDRKL